MRVTISAPLTAALLLAVLLLAGCEHLGNLDPDTLKARYGWTEEKMVAKGWLPGRYIPAKPVYCYQTIAQPECFNEPQPGQEARLVGYFNETAGY
jgi:hypothetical protein